MYKKIHEKELTEEQLSEIPDDLAFQESFDLANENARLDDIYPEYKGETINIDGKEYSVYNSNGERIAKSKEALTNFWRWFGDSKVVDEQGRPLVVYHGSRESFDVFDIEKSGSATGNFGYFGKGFYFTTNIQAAKDYGADGFRSFYLKANNPYISNKKSDRELAKQFVKKYNIKYAPDTNMLLGNNNLVYSYNFLEDINNEEKIVDLVILTQNGNYAEQFSELLKELGYDGLRYEKGAYNELLVFEPNQIKSVNNRGTYSSDTGNIYFQDRQIGKGGAYDSTTRSITLGGKADATTLPHELAHYWIDKNFKWAKSGNAFIYIHQPIDLFVLIKPNPFVVIFQFDVLHIPPLHDPYPQHIDQFQPMINVLHFSIRPS